MDAQTRAPRPRLNRAALGLRGPLGLALLALAAACLASPNALADGKPTLSGSWSASAMSESWSFDNWVESCGPKPRPSGGGGGAVQIREQGGELSIVGAGRAWSTSECWEQAPGLSRVSHSQSGGGRFWRTRCSVSNDKQHITVTTTVSATDVSLSVTEIAEHKATPSPDVTCTANVTRSRSMSLNKRDGEEAAPSASASASAAPSSTPAATPPAASVETNPRASAAPTNAKAPAKTCKETGDPAELSVYPARKVLRPGDRFSFRAVVVDEESCALAVKPTWAVGQGALAAKVTVDPSGTVTIAEGAEEGRIEVFATIAGKSVAVTVEVTSPSTYDALLSAGTLEPKGAEQGASVVIATGAVGGRKGVADDVGRERKQIFVAIVVALAFTLGFVGLVLLRRGKRPPETEDDAETEEEAETAKEAWAKAETGAAEEASAKRTGEKKVSGKVCPTCGARFGADALFCGEDGTTLVPLNR